MSESKKITKKQLKTVQDLIIRGYDGGECCILDDSKFVNRFLSIFKFNSDGKITSPNLSGLSKEDAKYCCKCFRRFIELKNSKYVTIEMKEGCADKIYDIDQDDGYFLAIVGKCYKDGKCLEQNYKKALKFLKKAVENCGDDGLSHLDDIMSEFSGRKNLEELNFAKEACEILKNVDPENFVKCGDQAKKYKAKAQKLLPQINAKIEKLSSKLKKSSASTKALSTTSSHKSSTKSRRFRSRKDESKSKHHNKDNDEYDNEYDNEEEETPPISGEQKQNSKPVKKASSSKFNGNNNNNEPNNTTNSKLMRSSALKFNGSSIKSTNNIQSKRKIKKQKNSNTNSGIDDLDKIEEEEKELTNNSEMEIQNQQPEQNRLNLSSGTNNEDDNENEYEYLTPLNSGINTNNSSIHKVGLLDKLHNFDSNFNSIDNNSEKSNIVPDSNNETVKNNDEESDFSTASLKFSSDFENQQEAIKQITTNSPQIKQVKSKQNQNQARNKLKQQQRVGELRNKQEKIIKQTNQKQNQKQKQQQKFKSTKNDKDTKQSQSYQKISDQFYKTIKDLNKAFIKRENDKVTNEEEDGSTEFNLDEAKQTLKNHTKQYLEASIRLNRQKQAEVEKIYDNKYKKTKKQQAIVSPPTGTLKAITSFIKDKTKKLDDAGTIASVKTAEKLDNQDAKADKKALEKFRNSTLPEGGFGGEFYITGDNKIVIELDKEGFTGRSAKEYGMGDLINNEKINITIQLEGQSDNYLLNQQLAIATAFKNDPLYAFNRFIDNKQYIVNINGAKDNNAEKLKQLFYVMSEAKKMEINDRINLEKINGSFKSILSEDLITKLNEEKQSKGICKNIMGVKYNEANKEQKLLYNRLFSELLQDVVIKGQNFTKNSNTDSYEELLINKMRQKLESNLKSVESIINENGQEIIF